MRRRAGALRGGGGGTRSFRNWKNNSKMSQTDKESHQVSQTNSSPSMEREFWGHVVGDNMARGVLCQPEKPPPPGSWRSKNEVQELTLGPVPLRSFLPYSSPSWECEFLAPPLPPQRQQSANGGLPDGGGYYPCSPTAGSDCESDCADAASGTWPGICSSTSVSRIPSC